MKTGDVVFVNLKSFPKDVRHKFHAGRALSFDVQGKLVGHAAENKRTWVVQFESMDNAEFNFSTKRLRILNPSTLTHRETRLSFRPLSEDLDNSNSNKSDTSGVRDVMLPHLDNQSEDGSSSESEESIVADHFEPIGDVPSSSESSREDSANQTKQDASGSSDNRIKVNGLQWKHEIRNMDIRELDGAGINRRSTVLKPGRAGLNSTSSKLQFFKAFFYSSGDISRFVSYTNQRLSKHSRSSTSKDEFMKLIGMLLLTTTCPNVPRSMLFGTSSRWSVVSFPNFSRFMTESRFNYLVSCLSFSDECDETDDDVVVELNEDRNADEDVFRGWYEVQELIDGFNRIREEYIDPGSRLCVDESVSKWRGKDGVYYSNGDGMPQVSKIARKSEPIGTEMKSMADCETGIMLRLELRQPKEDRRLREYGSKYQKSTATVMRLCKPYAGSGRTVYADSAFASVATAVALKAEHGLYFIGSVKTATKSFPLAFIKNHFQTNGEPGDGTNLSLGAKVVQNSVTVPVFATAWNDMKLKHFVSTCGLTTPGEPHIRSRHRIRLDTRTSVIQERSVPRDKTTSEYYDNAGAVDMHNNLRQGHLTLERFVTTRKWRIRIFCTLLGMCITDAFYAYKAFASDEAKDTMPFWVFVVDIAESLLVHTPESIQISDTDTCGHRLRGLTQLNRELEPSERWASNNPKIRCRDCSGFSKQAAKYCVECTALNTEDASHITRSDVHGVCTQCQHSHDRRFLQGEIPNK